MTAREATRHMFDRYREMLEGKNFTGPELGDATNLRWMCDTVDCENWPLDKISRWLGFVQGVMILNGLTTVNVERDYSRPLFAPVPPVKESWWAKTAKIENKYQVFEILASVLTLIGMAVGSSTAMGNDFYLASQVFWWGLVVSRRMWGLLPLNIAMTGIEIWHFCH